jgi:glycosyltransferase involved in cell wall biosynthesis
MNETVSVIIPNYNNLEFLDECIQSVLIQTYQNFEIVVIDDCSEDGSRDYLLQLPKLDTRIKILLNDARLGVSGSRKKGIESCVGEFITTLDADDFYINQNKIQAEMQALLCGENRHGSDCVAYSNIAYVDKKSRMLKQLKQEIKNTDNKLSRISMLCRSSFIPRDMLIRKELYIRVGGFDITFTMYEDWDLKIRLAACSYYVYSGEDGVAYRQHDRGLSKSGLKANILSRYKVLVKNLREDSISLKIKCFATFFQWAVKSMLTALKRCGTKMIGVK